MCSLKTLLTKNTNNPQ